MCCLGSDLVLLLVWFVLLIAVCVVECLAVAVFWCGYGGCMVGGGLLVVLLCLRVELAFGELVGLLVLLAAWWWLVFGFDYVEWCR